jgi:hypothetical protein
MHIEYWWESQKEREHQEDRDTIKMDLRDRMGWYGLNLSGSE